VPQELVVDGPFPFVRCLAADPPSEGERTVGSQRWFIEGRDLSIEGVEAPLELAIFAGPAPGATNGPALAAALRRAEGADVVVVLGGIGDREEEARQTLGALAAIGPGVVVLAGGRDEATVWQAAFESSRQSGHDHVVDASGLAGLTVAGERFALVSGAALGRYARNADACGYAARDLDAVFEAALDEGLAAERPWVLGWNAPEGAVAAGFEGASGGDPELRARMEANEMRGGFFAWPETQVGAEDGMELVVPPVAGPVLERADGTRVSPTVTRIRFEAAGWQRHSGG
jgi:hypothetical protein